MSLSFFENLLIFWLSTSPGSTSYAFPAPVMKSAISPKSLFSALVWDVEIKIWVIGVVVATAVSLLLDFVSTVVGEGAGEKCTHTYTWVFLLLCLFIVSIMSSYWYPSSQSNITRFRLAFSLPYLSFPCAAVRSLAPIILCIFTYLLHPSVCNWFLRPAGHLLGPCPAGHPGRSRGVLTLAPPHQWTKPAGSSALALPNTLAKLAKSLTF